MRTTLAGLDVRVLQEASGPPTSAVVLCHGFGAPGDDLVPLQRELLALEPALASTRFYFPAAPLTLSLGFGDARAWWMIDVEALARLQAGDPHALRRFRQVEPPGMAQARTAVRALTREIVHHTGLPMSRLVLGGFSQGAMVTTDVTLRLEEAPAGLVILSGTLLLEDEWRKRAPGRVGLPVFQSHGRHDPLLSFEAAEALRDLLVDGGLSVVFDPFDGGHTIGPGTLPRLATFLRDRLG